MAFKGFFWSLLITPLLLWDLAQSQIIQGAGFDPVPLQLPSAKVREPLRQITMMDLLTLRDIGGISISPNGKLVAFVLEQAVYDSNSYRTGLFIVSTAERPELKCLGSAGIPHWNEINSVEPEAPQWSQDSKRVRLRAKWENQTTWQVWEWSVDGGAPTQLTHVPGDVEEYQESVDGSAIVLKVRPKPDPSFARNLSESGILYDGLIQAWEGLPVTSEILEVQPPKEESWILAKDFQERKASDMEAGQLRPNLQTENCGIPTKPGYARTTSVLDEKTSPDKQVVAFRCYLGDSSPYNSHLFTRFLNSNQTVDLTPDAYCLDQYWWSADSTRVFYSICRGDGHSDQLASISPNGTKRANIPINDQGYFLNLSLDSSGNLLAVTRETNTVPQQVAVIDLRANVVRTLVDVNPEFASIQMSSPVRIEGVNKYGEKWFGHLVKPLAYVAGRRYPLIVTTYHSGDWFLRGASGNENPIQVYAANGFMVLSFDVGKNPPVPAGDFKAAVRIWSSPTASIEAAVHRLCSAGLVDPERVGVTGFSHGSEIMAYAIGHTKLFSAASGGADGREPYFYYMAGKEWHDIFATWGLGGWPEGRRRKRWEAIAATLNANHINTPLLINAADSEFLGDLALFTSLQELKKPVELFIYTNELHYKNQPKHRYDIYQRNLDWFKFWLMGTEDSSPYKSAQYKRWSEMKNVLSSAE
jgi:dipeptidyl aminopeptidase/acylaminoacyl peptidase